ncbi:MAG: Fis family transcriptional regulator [Xenococcus sp. (in: cyanobacteria)]
MARITKHRDRILEALRQWFCVNKEAPSLEELCQELNKLGMKRPQRGTLQKWLKTMRGIDVEWDDDSPRSLRLIHENPPGKDSQISTAETLRYVTTGLIEWEKQQPDKRDNIPEALRIGMSQMYLQSLLADDESVAQNIPEFLEQANQPLVNWQPASDIQNLSPEITLIEDGFTSEFTRQWQVEGSGVTKQVQEQVLKDVLDYCRGHQLAEEYRAFRYLVIVTPVLEYSEYRRILYSSEFRPLQDFLIKSYIDLDKFEEHDVYHFCPRCGYVQRKLANGTYHCRHQFCDRLSVKLNLPPKPTIPRDKADRYKIVTPGIHQFGTVPGISELYLAAEFRKLGLKVTLWAEIDEYDLLVEFDKKRRWAIDVKDWAHLYEDGLNKVNYRFDATETFVVFPDEREETLRLKVVREQKEKELKGVKLRLISEILAEAKNILDK